MVTFSARQEDTAAVQNDSGELQEMLRAWIPKKRKAKYGTKRELFSTKRRVFENVVHVYFSNYVLVNAFCDLS